MLLWLIALYISLKIVLRQLQYLVCDIELIAYRRTSIWLHTHTDTHVYTHTDTHVYSHRHKTVIDYAKRDLVTTPSVLAWTAPIERLFSVVRKVLRVKFYIPCD